MNLKDFEYRPCGYGTLEKTIDRITDKLMDKQDFNYKHGKKGTDTKMKNTAKQFNRAMKRIFGKKDITKIEYLDFALLYFNKEVK